MATFTQSGSSCLLSGQLDQQAVLALWPQRTQLVAAETEYLDLTQLHFSDSAGLAFLFELLSLAAANGQTLRLTSPAAQVKKLIELYDLNDFFEQ